MCCVPERMSVHHMHAGPWGGQKNCMKLELEAVVCRHLGAGNWTQALHKSSKYSQPLRHLSSPYASLYNWSPEAGKKKKKYLL